MPTMRLSTLLLPMVPPALLLLGGCAPETQLHLGLSVHLEAWEVEDPQVRATYLQLIDQLAEAAEAEGLGVSWEVGAGLVAVDDPQVDALLRELEDRGHEVGVHADLGGDPTDGLSQEAFATALRERRDDLLDAGVQADHVSGICSHLDWVAAAQQAGFTVNAGMVRYCLQSLDPALAPVDLSDCTSAAECHDLWPPSPPANMLPWRADDGDSWILAQPTGGLLLVPEADGLACASETLAGEGDGACTFDSDDADALGALVDQARQQLEPGEVGAWRVATSLGPEPDRQAWGAFMAAAAEVTQQEGVSWSTTRQLAAALP